MNVRWELSFYVPTSALHDKVGTLWATLVLPIVRLCLFPMVEKNSVSFMEYLRHTSSRPAFDFVMPKT